jgi:hypothetical protein
MKAFNLRKWLLCGCPPQTLLKKKNPPLSLQLCFGTEEDTHNYNSVQFYCLRLADHKYDNQYKRWIGYTGIKPLKIGERLLLSDQPFSICPGTSTENLDKQQFTYPTFILVVFVHFVINEFTYPVCRYKGQSKFNVFCALSQRNMLQVFLSCRMHNNWYNVPRNAG